MKTKVLQTTHLKCNLTTENVTEYRDVILSLHEKLESAKELQAGSTTPSKTMNNF